MIVRQPVNARRAIAAIIGAFVVLLQAIGPAAAATEWVLDKQEEGIDIYTRPVEGSGIKEFKGIAEVESGLDAVLQVLRDADGFKNWFPNTPESRLLDREGDVSYQYSVMKTPWPVSDRDNVFRSVTERDDETGIVTVKVTAAPDYYPEQADHVRVQKANGVWRLEPLGKQKTRVTFIMHLEPGGGIPEWMINVRVVETPFEALTNLRVAAGN
jgi:hypothetical protein